MDPVVVRNFAIALLIGALVGLEREKRKASEAGHVTVGIRTFILVALIGAVSAWLSQQLQTWAVFVVAVAAVAVVVVAGYLAETSSRKSTYGLTTEMAVIAVCLLGGASLFGYPEVAVALGIVTSAVLAFKRPIHRLVSRLDTDDIYAGLKLLIATFVVLPLLPNRAVDPWGALNPYQLWWLVILISSLSLVGYVAMRWVGPATGTALTGLFGGLVSSTAVSLSFAKRSREADAGVALGRALAAGLLLAWCVMFVRVVIEVAVVHAPLVPSLIVPFGAMAAVTVAFAGYHYWRSLSGSATQDAPEVKLKNPFSLSSAIKFALFFGAVLLIVSLVQHYLPGRGLYAVAALAGLTDVDAITLSMAGLARDGGDPKVALASIVIAALTNTAVKCGLVVALGAPQLRRRIVVAAVAIVAAAIVAL